MNKKTDTNQLIAELKKKNLSNDLLFDEFKNILDKKNDEISLLQKKYDNLNVIVDLIPSTISWINDDLTYFNVNSALAKTCELTPADFVGRSIGFHTKENFFYEFATELFRSSQNTLYRELDAKIKGEEKVFLVTGTKINNNKQAVIIGIDITELKNLKGHISLTERLATLGEMFAGIIHDINNPLMMIDHSAKKLLKKADSTDEESIQIINKILMTSEKISKIVQGIKIYVHDAGPEKIQKENLGQIIDDAIIICEHKLKSNAIKLQYDYAIKAVDVQCNFTQMFQVFVNLISNSIDAIAKNKDRWIEITFDNTDSKFVKVYFTDSGPGIPKDIAQNIFHAFYTTKEKGIGSGLGLSLSKKILENHGGDIQINSDNSNTQFVITIPKHLGK